MLCEIWRTESVARTKSLRSMRCFGSVATVLEKPAFATPVANGGSKDCSTRSPSRGAEMTPGRDKPSDDAKDRSVRTAAEGALPREIDLRDLLGESNRVMIRHGAERYVLRLTRQNKLILTK